ncbi:MAG TPA: RNA 2',3'-cyclic phosphodiesterase [Planctomycetota bacterium]|nr:RNA 2',3'-cyclic phosphodiesterase [Planctomycetota bacterium]
MRAFLAVEVPEAFAESYSHARDRLAEPMSSLRWVRPDQLHLTLRFFGEIPEDRGDLLREPIAAIASEHPEWSARLGELGVFGSRASPRVLWLGVEDRGGRLARLQAAIETAVRGAGFPPESRPWRPHITLARGKQPARRGRGMPRDALEEVAARAPEETASWPGLDFPVRELVLLSSVLGSGGSVYTPRWRVRLPDAGL